MSENHAGEYAHKLQEQFLTQLEQILKAKTPAPDQLSGGCRIRDEAGVTFLYIEYDQDGNLSRGSLHVYTVDYQGNYANTDAVDAYQKQIYEIAHAKASYWEGFEVYPKGKLVDESATLPAHEYEDGCLQSHMAGYQLDTRRMSEALEHLEKLAP